MNIKKLFLARKEKRKIRHKEAEQEERDVILIYIAYIVQIRLSLFCCLCSLLFGLPFFIYCWWRRRRSRRVLLASSSLAALTLFFYSNWALATQLDVLLRLPPATSAKHVCQLFLPLMFNVLFNGTVIVLWRSRSRYVFVSFPFP